MKCPLMKDTVTYEDGGSFWMVADCLKGECAWWDETLGYCDPTGLASTLEGLVNEVAELRRTMPYKREI